MGNKRETMGNAPLYDAQRKILAKGKHVVITGGNTGIGYETAKELYTRGANVTILCRNVEKMNAAIAQITQKEAINKIIGIEMDLSSFDSVRSAAETITRNKSKIDICILNAGIMKVPLKLCEGFESEQCVNHFSHFLFLSKIMPLIQNAEGKPRVISLSSAAHAWADDNIEKYWKRYNNEQEYKSNCADSMGSWVPYANSKLANILHMEHAATLYNNIGFYAVHPGIVDTELGRYWLANSKMTAAFVGVLMKPFRKTSQQGAQTSIYCSLAPELEDLNYSGKYFSDLKEDKVIGVMKNQEKRKELAQKLWDISHEVTD